MKNLAELAALSKTLDVTKLPCETWMIYGETKTGKTRLACMVAKSPLCERLFLFSGENGEETVIRMVHEGVLTMEEAAKIMVIKMVDMPDTPYFYETMVKVYTVHKDLKICEEHGRVFCPKCTAAKVTEGWLDFNLMKLGKKDWVVLDTGSQLGISVMAYLMKGRPIEDKPDWNEYGPQGRILSDILSVVQAATCNHIWVTHVMVLDDMEDINKDPESKQKQAQPRDKFYPLVGTKPFSITVGKYFGTNIFLQKKLGKHMGGSGSLFNTATVCGSRIGLQLELDQSGLTRLPELMLAAKKGEKVAPSK